MKRYIIILILMLPVALPAQEKRLVVRNFDVNLIDQRPKTDPVYDQTGKPAALIEITLATTDSLHVEGNYVGYEYEPGKLLVYMPSDSKWIDLALSGCEPFHFDFPVTKPLLPGTAYILELGIKKLNPMRTLIMPTFSYNKSQLSYGIMLALGKKNGGFVHAKTDFHFGLSPQLSCDADGNVNGTKGWFTGASQKSRFAITAGYMRQIFDMKDGNMGLYIFAGGGYGSRILAWEMYQSENTYDYARVEPYSFTGFEVELGALYRLGPVAISIGVQTNQFKYYEANVGIGVMF